MRVLILGGTRFIGKALAELLTHGGHEVWVSSRRPENAPVGAFVKAAERADALNELKARSFEYVIDFTCYGELDANSVLTAFPDAHIILISTIWVTRLAKQMRADALFPEAPFMLDGIHRVTENYLTNKIAAERVFYKHAQHNRNSMIMRLPIVWGSGDHTKRMDFYRTRLIDRNPLIFVNGANNLAQISWHIDVAQGISRLITDHTQQTPFIMEAATDSGRPVSQILYEMAESLDVELVGVNLPEQEVTRYLPDYLDDEPLWREQGRDLTINNLFQLVKMNPTPMHEWLKDLPRLQLTISEGRAREIDLMRTRDLAKYAQHRLSPG